MEIMRNPTTIKVIVLVLLNMCTGNETKTIAMMIHELFEGYDQTVAPNYAQEQSTPVEVSISIFIHSMFSISEAHMDYSMSFFLRARWKDERLRYNDTINSNRLELDRFYFDKVWMPDIYIIKEKQSDFHEVAVPNKLFHIYPDGIIRYSAKVTGVFSCLMYLKVYPFDKQSCKIEIESYGHSNETMEFIWSDGGMTVPNNIEFPRFSIKDEFEYFNCANVYYGVSYPCVGVSFILERKYAFYILQVYLPGILTVSLSWISFWLDYTAVPARITLGLLTVLTMTTQSSAARDNLPHVSYIKALDIYMATCLTFVFLGFLEFAIVNVLARSEEKRRNRYINDTQSSEDMPASNAQTEIKETKGKVCGSISVSKFDISRVRPNLIDKISRITFPLAFILFNVFYWIYYFHLEH